MTTKGSGWGGGILLYQLCPYCGKKKVIYDNYNYYNKEYLCTSCRERFNSNNLIRTRYAKYKIFEESETRPFMMKDVKIFMNAMFKYKDTNDPFLIITMFSDDGEIKLSNGFMCTFEFLLIKYDMYLNCELDKPLPAGIIESE